MKTIVAGYQAKLDAAVATRCNCVEITLADGTVQRFTDHPVAVTVGGNVYTPDASFERSEVISSGDFASDLLEAQILLGAAGGISRADLEAGRYDGAAVRVFEVDYTDPDAGSLELRRGRMGQVNTRQGLARAEIRGLSDRLRTSIGRDIRPTCDAELGDSRCGVDLGPLTASGSATSVTSRQVFTDSALAAAVDLYRFGKIAWTSGDNAGLAMEVRGNAAGGVVTLVQPMPRAIQVGDAYSVVPGCDKTTDTCKATYDNFVNFRGFPHVPGGDAAQDRPDPK